MEKLGINGVQLAAQLLNVGLLLLILKKFLYKPVLHMLEKRRAQIEENDRLSKELKDREEQLVKSEKELERVGKERAHQALLLSQKVTRKQSAQLLKIAQDEATKRAKEIIDAAKNKQKSDRVAFDRAVVEQATVLANRALVSLLGSDLKQKITEREVSKLLDKQ